MKTVSDALDFIRNKAVDREDYALAVWYIDDVLDLAREWGKKLTKKQAREVISLVDRKQDATIGISWDTLDAWIDVVLAEAKKKR